MLEFIIGILCVGAVIGGLIGVSLDVSPEEKARRARHKRWVHRQHKKGNWNV